MGSIFFMGGETVIRLEMKPFSVKILAPCLPIMSLMIIRRVE